MSRSLDTLKTKTKLSHNGKVYEFFSLKKQAQRLNILINFPLVSEFFLKTFYAMKMEG